MMPWKSPWRLHLNMDQYYELEASLGSFRKFSPFFFFFFLVGLETFCEVFGSLGIALGLVSAEETALYVSGVGRANLDLMREQELICLVFGHMLNTMCQIFKIKILYNPTPCPNFPPQSLIKSISGLFGSTNAARAFISLMILNIFKFIDNLFTLLISCFIYLFYKFS